MNKLTSDSELRSLWFQCGSQRFAVPMSHLREVIPVTSLRKVPMTEPALAGFMDLRDQVIPVFNPRALVSADAPDFSLPAVVIVVSLHDQESLGLLADRIGRVVQTPPPRPLDPAVRSPASFLGQTTTDDNTESLLVDVPGMANAFGLKTAVAA
mgnify:CR=1 FL=1